MSKVIRRICRGFTLIEMLVVIAIIAILAALLVGPIGAAQRNARKAYCLNNVKEIAKASELLFAETGDMFPVVQDMNSKGERAQLFLPYLGNNYDAFDCPSQKNCEDFGDADDFRFPTNTDRFAEYEINGYLVQPAGFSVVRSQRLVTDASKVALVYDVKYWDDEVTAHSGGANVGYLDGHGSWLPRELMGLEKSENCKFFNLGHDVYEVEAGPSECDGE